jgi:hypothetical protein
MRLYDEALGEPVDERVVRLVESGEECSAEEYARLRVLTTVDSMLLRHRLATGSLPLAHAGCTTGRSGFPPLYAAS